MEQRRTSGGKELRPVAPLAFGVRAFSALPRHFFRSWTTDKASSGTGDSSSQEVSPGWGSSYRHPPRTEMPSGPVLLPSTPPFPPLVLRCSNGLSTAGARRSFLTVLFWINPDYALFRSWPLWADRGKLCSKTAPLRKASNQAVENRIVSKARNEHHGRQILYFQSMVSFPSWTSPVRIRSPAP